MLRTPCEKVKILINSEYRIPIPIACKAVGISTKTYYNHKDDITMIDWNLRKNAHNLLLNEGEEQLIIQMIFDAQQNCEYLRGHDAKIKAQELYHERTSEQREFDKDWLQRFLMGHQNEIGKIKTSSVDEQGGNISINAINKYVDAVLNVLPKIKDLRLILNMTNVGLGNSRIIKKDEIAFFIKNVKFSQFGVLKQIMCILSEIPINHCDVIFMIIIVS